MARLRFCIGTVLDFADAGIQSDGHRISTDGTKMVVHQEDLTDGQFDAILNAIDAGKPFVFLSADNQTFISMMTSPEWTAQLE